VVRVSAADLDILDTYEGVHSGNYRRTTIPVQTVDGQQLQAQVYLSRSRQFEEPSEEYLQAVATTIGSFWRGSGGRVRVSDIPIRNPFDDEDDFEDDEDESSGEILLRSFQSIHEPFEEFRNVMQTPEWSPRWRDYNGWKPAGLWYSCDNDWMKWLKSDWVSRYKESKEGYDYKIEVDLSQMKVIRTLDELWSFTRQYAFRRLFSYKPYPYIDWAQVAERYAGIEICPYQQEARFDLDWYYPWDVASGCIWNKAALVRVTPINRRAKQAKLQQLMSTQRRIGEVQSERLARVRPTRRDAMGRFISHRSPFDSED